MPSGLSTNPFDCEYELVNLLKGEEDSDRAFYESTKFTAQIHLYNGDAPKTKELEFPFDQDIHMMFAYETLTPLMDPAESYREIYTGDFYVHVNSADF